MPSNILQSHSRYGGLIKFDIRGREYLFRPLTYAEFKSADKLGDTPELSDAILELCIVQGDLSIIPHEQRDHIADWIRASSSPDPKILDDLRELVKTDDMTPIITLICSVFPSYTPDDLLNMSMLELMYRMTLAEHVTKLIQDRQGPGGPPDTMAEEYVGPGQLDAALTNNLQKHLSIVTRRQGRA